MNIEYQQVFCPQCHRTCMDYGKSFRFIDANKARCGICSITIWYNGDIRKFALITGPVEGNFVDKVYEFNDFKRILKLKAFV